MNLFELFIKVGVDDQASNKLKDLGGKLGNGLKTAAKIGTTAVVAASTAIVALTKNAVESYAEYEQLVGGVDTLFKNASQKLQNYAAEAYKTSGMSANEYMANATSFSASLISSLGGDTEAAAEYANRAMVSMSDNANKMGTSLESIVQTYQSLSRGNMAMLDNLKLGYGGTKAELQRLIKDASTYTDIQKQMGVTVDESSMSFDNIVNAIAVVQGKLGIAGATAQEAATTIEGSVISMKGAWQNLVVGIADDNADFSQLMTNFVDSVGTVAENILPRVQIALTGVGNLIDGLFPVIVEKIPAIFESVIPKLAESAVKIFQSLIDGINQNQGSLIASAFSIISTLATGILNLLPQIVALGLNLIVSLATGIAENLDTLIPAIVDVVMQIYTTVTDPATLSSLVDAAIAILFALVDGIIAAMPILLEQAPVIVVNLVSAIIENAPKLVKAAFSLVSHFITSLTGFIGESVGNVAQAVRDWFNTSILQPITNFVTQTWNKIVSFFAPLIGFVSPILQALKELFDTIWEAIKILVGRALDNIKSKISTVWNSIVSVLTAILNTIKNIVSSAFNSLYSAVEGPLNRVKSIVSNAFNTVRSTIYSVVQSAWTWGADMIQNFINGITAKASALVAKVRAVAQSVRDYVGFSEPKKGPLSNFHTYAPDMMDLFMKGIQDNKPRLLSVVADTFDFRDNMAGFSTGNITSSYGSHRNTGSSYGVGGVSVVQNIYSQAKTAADLMQEAKYQQERAVLLGV